MYTIFRTFYLCCSYNFSSQLFPAHEAGVRMIALRCAGFDRVDLKAAEQHGITVARVPAYSNLSANCIQQKLETEQKINKTQQNKKDCEKCGGDLINIKHLCFLCDPIYHIPVFKWSDFECTPLWLCHQAPMRLVSMLWHWCALWNFPANWDWLHENLFAVAGDPPFE